MDDELKKILLSMQEEMKVMNYKLDRHSERFDDLELKTDNLDIKIRNAESNIRKDIRKLFDNDETIIEVLKQHDMLPR